MVRDIRRLSIDGLGEEVVVGFDHLWLQYQILIFGLMIDVSFILVKDNRYGDRRQVIYSPQEQQVSSKPSSQASESYECHYHNIILPLSPLGRVDL